MKATVVVVTALVVVGAGAPLVAASGSGPLPSATAAGSVPETLETPDNETGNASVSPGAKLAGVVNVQAAEVEGEIQARSFGLQMAAARSNASKVGVVAAQAEDLDRTLAELRERKRALLEAKRNGSVSRPRFRAEMAGLAAEISTARRLSNVTASTAGELPRAKLEASGVDVDAIQRLRTSAANLSGPAVSSVARGIAGVSNGTGGAPVGLGSSEPGLGGAPGPVDGGNWSVGSDGGVSVGSGGNVSVGGGSGSDASSNASLVPDPTAVPNASDATDVVNDTTDDSVLNTSDDSVLNTSEGALTAVGALSSQP